MELILVQINLLDAAPEPINPPEDKLPPKRQSWWEKLIFCWVVKDRTMNEQIVDYHSTSGKFAYSSSKSRIFKHFSFYALKSCANITQEYTGMDI